ncbi:hypothetical protein [Brevibacillus sp. MCWH]|nr:hypothetical protein [Brevibacillus sp. MCWH]
MNKYFVLEPEMEEENTLDIDFDDAMKIVEAGLIIAREMGLLED